MEQNKTHYRPRVKFTKKMKKEYTILCPMMAPIHASIILPVFAKEGLNVKIIESGGAEAIEKGLKYVHNDLCYPGVLVTGQMINAVESGKYDPDKIAMVITQSGGGCRDSNYINLMRKSMERAGYPQIPFISANIWGLELNSGIDISIRGYRMLLSALMYGDMMMIAANQVRPYEVNKGDADRMMQKWTAYFGERYTKGKGYSHKEIKKNIRTMLQEFADIEVKKVPKVKVAVVGELYLKYSAPANNDLEQFLRDQDCETYFPSVLGFGIYKTNGALEDLRLYGGKPMKRLILEIAMKYMFYMENMMISIMEEFDCFVAPERVEVLKKRAEGIINTGNSMGEGWYIAAEMMEFVAHGYENVICVQPFGCLPCHVSVKGMLNKIRRIEPKLNAVDIEYDPGATKVNQENRIKLMLSVARENMKKEEIK